MTSDLRRRLAEALRTRSPRRVTVPEARDAAVLIPIVGGPEPELIFTVRTETLRSHKGQISFPGGSIDATDRSPSAAAVREAHEEIGLHPSNVAILGELDSFPTFVSGYVVTPVIGWLEEAPTLIPNPAEVARILQVPLTSFTEEIRAEPGFSHRDVTYPTEAWIWNDNVIWGVTARIVRSFLVLLAEIGVIEPPGETMSWDGWDSETGKAS